MYFEVTDNEADALSDMLIKKLWHNVSQRQQSVVCDRASTSAKGENWPEEIGSR